MSHKSDDTPDASDTSDMESVYNSDEGINEKITYNINQHSNLALKKLLAFLDTSKFLNESKDPTTNIVDRRSGKCYKIPDEKLGKFFDYLENCRKEKLPIMFNEKQQPNSCMMVDFDIYQKTADSQIEESTYYRIAQVFAKFLLEILDITDKEVAFHIAFTQKPKPKYDEDKQLYKDGLHVLIYIKVAKEFKRFFLNYLDKRDICNRIFASFEAGTPKNTWLDPMSFSVPVHFYGNSTKPGSPAYVLKALYEIRQSFEMKDEDPSIISIKTRKLDKYNLSHEFAVSYEVPNGLIKKIQRQAKAKYMTEISSYVKTKPQQSFEEDDNMYYHKFSMLCQNDINARHIKEILDILAPKRYTEYGYWRDTIFMLANESESYKVLAEYFSKKCAEKFNQTSFDQLWTSAITSQSANPIQIATLHMWAREDNLAKYDLIRLRDVVSYIYDNAMDKKVQGHFQHAHFAKILYKILKHKYRTSLLPDDDRTVYWYEFITESDKYVQGELYKWKQWHITPDSLSKYISDVLPNILEKVLNRIEDYKKKQTGDLAKYVQGIYLQFQRSINKLSCNAFKSGVIKESMIYFLDRTFAGQLDKDPMILGVGNGILKLGKTPEFYQGYHTFCVMKHTTVDYVPFNPYDPITKTLLISVRSVFGNRYRDSFEFLMMFFASSLDGRIKESIFLIAVGGGSNGKSFVIELAKAVLGSVYAAKMPLNFITDKRQNAESATPALMQLLHARLAYYTESDEAETLNAAKIKEITSMEHMSGRRLHKDMMQFKPRANHIALTNNHFKIPGTDHGTWRRIDILMFPITFYDLNDPKDREKYDASNPFHRIANPACNREWMENPEIISRMLSILIWYYVKLQTNHNGNIKNVPRPHIRHDTEAYRNKEDTLNQFITTHFVKCSPDDESPQHIGVAIEYYRKWYLARYPDNGMWNKDLLSKFESSVIQKYIIKKNSGSFLIGHRFVEPREDPKEGEKYVFISNEEKKERDKKDKNKKTKSEVKTEDKQDPVDKALGIKQKKTVEDSVESSTEATTTETDEKDETKDESKATESKDETKVTEVKAESVEWDAYMMSETPEEFYQALCKEYDAIKELFQHTVKMDEKVKHSMSPDYMLTADDDEKAVKRRAIIPDYDMKYKIEPSKDYAYENKSRDPVEADSDEDDDNGGLPEMPESSQEANMRESIIDDLLNGNKKIIQGKLRSVTVTPVRKSRLNNLRESSQRSGSPINLSSESESSDDSDEDS